MVEMHQGGSSICTNQTVLSGGEKKKTDCQWPVLHKHQKEWQEQKTFRGIVMGSLTSDFLKPSLRSAAQESQQMKLVGEEEIMASVTKRMQDVLGYLHTGLGEVYSKEDRKMINNIRTLLDLEKLLAQTKEMSIAVVSQREVRNFLQAAEVIDEDLKVKYDTVELRFQFRIFVEKLSTLGEEKDWDQLTSMDILVKMMSTEEERWKGCEGIMDILCQAATKKTVESVVESWVSVLEHHSNKSRNLKAENIQSEMMIAVNGPLVQHSQEVVKESMKKYWGNMKIESLKSGHFTKRSNNVKSFCISKTLDSLNAVPVKTQFMV